MCQLLWSRLLSPNITLVTLVTAFELYTQVTKRRPGDPTSYVLRFGFTCPVTKRLKKLVANIENVIKM